MRSKNRIGALFGMLSLVACSRPAPAPEAPASVGASGAKAVDERIFEDPDRSLDERVRDLVGRLTLEEKASLMVDKAAGIERLGIAKYDAWNEALHGVAWRDGVTVFPQAIGLASTWDPELMHEVATAISTEARALANEGAFGLTLWSPVINIARDPRWGRTQEAYGEDPFLVSRMAVAYVRGIQGDHPFYLRAVATPKHFAMNNVEATRFTGSSNSDEELMFDYYLPHFRAAIVEGGAQSVMCAYNRINGVPSCANPWLLDTVLRKKWGFDGFVVSDCGAIEAQVWGHHVQKSEIEAVTVGLKAGCDLECGNGYREHLVKAVEQGMVTEADVDRSLGRVLAGRFRLGMFDPREKNPYASIPRSVVDGPAHRDLALKAARASLVLLKNDGTLPLRDDKLQRLAIVGPAANVFLHGSQGYHGTNNHLVSPREGLEKRLAQKVKLDFVPGTVMPSGSGYPTAVLPGTLLRTSGGESGLVGEYFPNVDLSGAPTLTRRDQQLDFDWGSGSPSEQLPSDGFSVRWKGKFTPPKSGHYLLSITGDDGYRLLLDGKKVLEDWTDHAPRTRGSIATLNGGQSYDVILEYYERGGGASIKLSYAFVENGTSEAVAAARRADAVVFFAGVDALAADEEKDFANLALPEDQVDLFAAVRATNPRTVLVLMSGNPLVLTPRELKASAIVQAWYPGQDTGTAIAELLLGDINPSGKTPITFYPSLDVLPPMEDYDIRRGRTYMYLAKAPTFPFGHGLSYTTFGYRDLTVAPATLRVGDQLRVSFDVENSGDRPGAEVVQVYIKPPVGPKHVLRAFRRIELARGARQRVSFDIPVTDLGRHDARSQAQVVDPGAYDVQAGASSGDIRLRANFEVVQ